MSVLSETLLPTTAPDVAHSKNFPRTSTNWNVAVMLALKFSTGLADNVWGGTVLASYLYEIMGQSNSYAGYVEAAQGMSSLIVSIPVGLLADRGSKARVIAGGGLLLPVAVAATSFADMFGCSLESRRINSRFYLKPSTRELTLILHGEVPMS